MKRIIIILAFLVCGISSAQQYFFNGTVYVPKTTVQINAITAPVNGRVEANSDTGSLWYFDGAIWKDTFVGVSSFADLTGDPYDNTMLSDALNSKAADSVVVKTSVDSQIQNLKLAVGDSAWIASKTFGANDIVINKDENPPGGDNYVTGGTLSGAGVLSLEMNYGPDITVPGFNSGGGGGTVSWGGIGGTIGDQTDMMALFNSKGNLTSSNYWTGSLNSFKGGTLGSAMSLGTIVSDTFQGDIWQMYYLNNKLRMLTATEEGDLISNLYTLDDSGTPIDSMDLVTKGYADSNYTSSSQGVFTANLTDSGGGATYTVGSSSKSYYAIGDLVYINLYFTSISVSGSPSGNLEITGISGLPGGFGSSSWVPNFTVSISSSESFSSLSAAGSNTTPNRILIYKSDTDTSTSNTTPLPAPSTIGNLRITGVFKK